MGHADVHWVLDGFENRFGYVPDANEIRLTAGSADAHPVDLPHPVSLFFEVIDEVSLPDMGNGCFLGPADQMVRRFVGGDPATVQIGGVRHQTLAFGSDGGGALFTIDLDADGAVLRVSEATVLGGVLQGDVQQVAPNLDTFLEMLTENVIAIGRGDEPSF